MGWRASRSECGSTAEGCPHHKTGQAKRDDDGLPREGGQVVGDLEVAAVVGQQHRVAHRGEGLNTLDEGVLLDAVVACPIQQIPTLRQQDSSG